MNERPLVDEARDVQRIVLCRVPARHTQHLVVRFDDPSEGRRWLGQLLRQSPVVAAAGRPPTHSAQPGKQGLQVDVGLSFRGLEALGVPGSIRGLLAMRSPAFAQGAALRAASHLGDTGASAPRRWDAAYGIDTAHALVTLHSVHASDLEMAAHDLERGAPALGPVAVTRLDLASRLEPPPGVARPAGDPGEWVHFGYRDGLSRVAIRGWHRETDTARPGPVGPYGEAPTMSRITTWHEPGEFLLGHRNDQGFNPWSLTTAAAPVRRFLRNGSFGVLRQIEQDEAEFRSALQLWSTRVVPMLQNQLAREHGAHAADITPERAIEWLKAKLCGRWPTGHGFDIDRWSQPGQRDPTLDFDHRHDPQGFGCPFGSHVRRMNPRGGELAHSVRQRVLIRRGQPYGPWYDKEPGKARGLMGLFFCASLEDQFEHLVGLWGDRVPLGSPDEGDAKDPLIGQHERTAAVFEIPLPGAPALRLDGFVPFVRTRGTLYLLYPSLSTLNGIAAGQPWADDDADAPVARGRPA